MNVYKSLTDIELLEKLSRSDDDAYVEIYNHYYMMTFRRAFLLTKNQTQSKEAVTNVFTRLLITKIKFNPSQSIASYLFGSIKSIIIEQSKPDAKIIEQLMKVIKTLSAKDRTAIERIFRKYPTNNYADLNKHDRSTLRAYINKLRHNPNYSLDEDNACIPIEPSKQLILPETPQIITDIRFVNQKILDRINRNPYEMYNLSPRQFEIMCAELYEERGYKVILTQETRDGGKDLIILDNRDIGRFKVYGECKRHAPDNPVSVNVVKQLAGNVWADKVTAGIVITSSYFSPDAKEFANRFEHQLSLMDFNHLQQMMLIN